MKSLISKLAFFAIVGIAASLGLIDPVSASAVGLIGAVVAVKSTPITNADTASLQTLNSATVAGGRVCHSRGVCTVANGDSIASTFRFCRIRSSDLVKEVKLDNATLGAACTMDFGLYRTAADGGAVVDADFFASVVDMNAVNRAVDITRESGVITVANMEKRVWQLLGLSSDPGYEYDVAGTLVAAAAAGGAVCVTVETVAGS